MKSTFPTLRCHIILTSSGTATMICKSFICHPFWTIIFLPPLFIPYCIPYVFAGGNCGFADTTRFLSARIAAAVPLNSTMYVVDLLVGWYRRVRVKDIILLNIVGLISFQIGWRMSGNNGEAPSRTCLLLIQQRRKALYNIFTNIPKNTTCLNTKIEFWGLRANGAMTSTYIAKVESNGCARWGL